MRNAKSSATGDVTVGNDSVVGRVCGTAALSSVHLVAVHTIYKTFNGHVNYSYFYYFVQN